MNIILLEVELERLGFVKQSSSPGPEGNYLLQTHKLMMVYNILKNNLRVYILGKHGNLGIPTCEELHLNDDVIHDAFGLNTLIDLLK